MFKKLDDLSRPDVGVSLSSVWWFHLPWKPKCRWWQCLDKADGEPSSGHCRNAEPYKWAVLRSGIFLAEPFKPQARLNHHSWGENIKSWITTLWELWECEGFKELNNYGTLWEQQERWMGSGSADVILKDKPKYRKCGESFTQREQIQVKVWQWGVQQQLSSKEKWHFGASRGFYVGFSGSGVVQEGRSSLSSGLAQPWNSASLAVKWLPGGCASGST